MNRWLIKIISCILCIVTIFSFSACRNNGENQKPNESTLNIGAEPISYDIKKENGKEVTLINDGYSEYKIIVPTDASYQESFAAKELQHFLELSTTCRLPIVNDATIDPTKADSLKFLSVGKTNLFMQSDIKLNAKMPRNAPRIKTEGNSVYMIGQTTDKATIYAVYKFLYYEIGFQAYSVDCVDYDYKAKLSLLDIDYNYEPNLEYVTGYNEVTSAENAEKAARLYIPVKDNMGVHGAINVGGEVDFAAWCHSVEGFIDPAIYAKDHPEWWGNGQPCYSQIMETDGLDMWEAVLQSAIDQLHVNDAPYIMLGGYDTQACCQCDLCKQGYDKYGISGVMIRFFNKIAEKLEEHYDECDKHKYEDVIFTCLAYQAYLNPPVNYDAEGNPIPKDPSVVLRHNTGVCYTPMHMCITHPIGGNYGCSMNEVYNLGLSGWSAVAKDNLIIYSYGYYDTGKLHYCDEWKAFHETYKAFDKNNVDYVLEQNASENGLEPFAALRIYVKSKLSWDLELDQDMLINDFMEHYYGSAANTMRQFFDEIEEHYDWMEEKNGTSCTSIYSRYVSSDNWPRNFMQRMETLLRSAMNIASQTPNVSKVEADFFEENCNKELMFIRFVNFTSYPSYYSEAEEAKERSELRYLLGKYKMTSSSGLTTIVL